MTAMVATPRADDGRLARRRLTGVLIGILIGVAAVQAAMVLMSLGSLAAGRIPGRLYFMLDNGGGVSAFAAFAATAIAVWSARRVGGQSAAVAAVVVFGLVAAFSMQVGTLCVAPVCDLPGSSRFSLNGYAIAVFLTGLASLFLSPKARPTP